MSLTITEALAEIKTINKRIDKKRESIDQYLARQDGVKDPLEKEGGSEKFIAQERQGVADMENRIVSLRRGIQDANERTMVSVSGESRSISDWLIWRRDVAPKQRDFMAKLRAKINGVRQNAQRAGQNVVGPGGTAEKPSDVIVNVNEQELAKQIESLEETLGTLDGQLSLKNATVIIKE